MRLLMRRILGLGWLGRLVSGAGDRGRGRVGGSVVCRREVCWGVVGGRMLMVWWLMVVRFRKLAVLLLWLMRLMRLM